MCYSIIQYLNSYYTLNMFFLIVEPQPFTLSIHPSSALCPRLRAPDGTEYHYFRTSGGMSQWDDHSEGCKDL
jgi:hypothetical protein